MASARIGRRRSRPPLFARETKIESKRGDIEGSGYQLDVANEARTGNRGGETRGARVCCVRLYGNVPYVTNGNENEEKCGLKIKKRPRSRYRYREL